MKVMFNQKINKYNKNKLPNLNSLKNNLIAMGKQPNNIEIMKII